MPGTWPTSPPSVVLLFGEVECVHDARDCAQERKCERHCHCRVRGVPGRGGRTASRHAVIHLQECSSTQVAPGYGSLQGLACTGPLGTCRLGPGVQSLGSSLPLMPRLGHEIKQEALVCVA